MSYICIFITYRYHPPNIACQCFSKSFNAQYYLLLYRIMEMSSKNMILFSQYSWDAFFRVTFKPASVKNASVNIYVSLHSAFQVKKYTLKSVVCESEIHVKTALNFNWNQRMTCFFFFYFPILLKDTHIFKGYVLSGRVDRVCKFD